MKNQFKITILFFFILSFLFISCSIKDVVCKKGSGSVITEERTVAAFKVVEARGDFKVLIFQEDSIKKQSVSVSAQESIIGLIQTRISGQSLIIEIDECYKTDEEVVVIIKTPALTQIVLAGSGDVILQDTARINAIEFVLSGSGNLRTTPNYPTIASNATIKLTGSGDIELDIKATSQIKASLEGSGNMILRGAATSNNLSLSGSGNLKAFNLPVLTSSAEIIGSGNIELTAIDTTNTISKATLNARISGSGKIFVKGNAVIQSQISGSGKVERVD